MTSEPHRLAFISLGDDGRNVEYTLPQGTLPETGRNVVVGYFVVLNFLEKWDITRGGKSWNSSTDGFPSTLLLDRV